MSGPAGLLIAGGASSRFGGAKALALLSGRPLLAWTHAALDAVCAQVAVSARADGEVGRHAASLGWPVVGDDPAHPSGPLAGLAAGLRWARRQGCSALVTLPVDTPLVRPADLRRLLEAAGAAPAAYARTPGGPHPLCAAWSVDLADPLNERLGSGDHPSVQGWLREIGAAAVDFEDEAAFRNVNTKADLAGLAGGGGSDA